MSRTAILLSALLAATLLSSSAPAADKPVVPDDFPKQIIPPGKDAVLQALLKPYWSAKTPQFEIVEAKIDKTYVKMDVKAGTTDGQMSLRRPDEEDQIDKDDKIVKAKDVGLIVGIHCPKCAEADAKTLNGVAEQILANQRASKDALWIDNPQPAIVTGPDGAASATPVAKTLTKLPGFDRRIWFVLLLAAIIGGVLLGRARNKKTEAPPPGPGT